MQRGLRIGAFRKSFLCVPFGAVAKSKLDSLDNSWSSQRGCGSPAASLITRPFISPSISSPAFRPEAGRAVPPMPECAFAELGPARAMRHSTFGVSQGARRRPDPSRWCTLRTGRAAAVGNCGAEREWQAARDALGSTRPPAPTLQKQPAERQCQQHRKLQLHGERRGRVTALVLPFPHEQRCPRQ